MAVTQLCFITRLTHRIIQSETERCPSLVSRVSTCFRHQEARKRIEGRLILERDAKVVSTTALLAAKALVVGPKSPLGAGGWGLGAANGADLRSSCSWDRSGGPDGPEHPPCRRGVAAGLQAYAAIVSMKHLGRWECC